MIFHFTATGNGKFAAETLAAVLDDRMINITDCVQNERYSFALEPGEFVGFVVPVYFFGIPMIVAEFLQKLRISADHDYYSYALLNCGGTTGNAGAMLRRAFPAKAIFSAAMVDNYVILYKAASDAEVLERLGKAEQALGKIAQRIQNQDIGDFDALKGHLSKAITFAAYPLYQHGRKTRKFTVNDRCTGCGLCQRICPREAIQLQDGTPRWIIPQCELCLGCLHRCPARAIDYGRKSVVNGRYVNPRVKF